MPYNTSTSFPPVGNPVYRIDTNWCMGDSLLYINANFFNLDSRTDALSTNVLSLSSQFKSLSGLSSQTIALRYNNRNDTLSGEVLNNSLGTIKLGGDILQSGRALLTAVSLSALRDVTFTTLNNNEALLWNSSTNRWENRPIILGAGAAIAPGDYGEIKIIGTSDWRVQSSPTIDSTRAITTDHIRNNAVTEAKINTSAVTEGKIGTSAVTETKIGAGAVTETKIGAGAVTETKIGAGAVTPTKLSTGAPTWNTSSNVGIGTALPNTRLTVAGNISATGDILGNNTSLRQSRDAWSVTLSSMSTITTLTSATTAQAGLMTARDRQLFEQLTEAIILSGQFIAEYLLVAGGGGSVTSSIYNGTAGGGAGGFVSGTIVLNSNTYYNIIIGAGGQGGTTATNGSNSSFNGLIAVGGGRGGAVSEAGVTGGSGGGGGYSTTSIRFPGGLGTFGQGLSGGFGIGQVSGSLLGGGGGGGGGASSPGFNGIGRTTMGILTAGDGGAGKQWFDSLWYAGGGGGGGGYYTSDTQALRGRGGIGGGGSGGYRLSNINPEPGVPNTGGGAGGTGSSSTIQTGVNGGSGIFVLRYPGSARCVGGAYSFDAVTNYSYHRFTTSDELFTAFNPNPPSLKVNYLVVAGGGAGGSGQTGVSLYSSGGGAGGALSGTDLLYPGNTRSITIGQGGTGDTSNTGAPGNIGQNTLYAGTVIALGGGGGGGAYSNGLAGGSGGGGTSPTQNAGPGTPDQGFSGGTLAGGGGGGGKTGPGSSGTGGPGIVWINGNTYARGGNGGGTGPTQSPGGPGTGNGGNGADRNPSTVNQTVGGAGGSGTVIISYPGTSARGTGGNISVSNGFVHHTFITNGTFTFTG